jgi:PAS domain S-box-containing protein
VSHTDLGFLFTGADMRNYKNAEEALRERTALLSNLLTSIPDVVFFKDRQGVYLGCNPEFARFANRDIPQIVGFTDYDLFPKDVADSFREQDRVMMEQGVPRHNEEWVTYPDGNRVLLDTFKAPLRDAEGGIIGLLGISRDITQRKLVEKALIVSEEEIHLFTGFHG